MSTTTASCRRSDGAAAAVDPAVIRRQAPLERSLAELRPALAAAPSAGDALRLELPGLDEPFEIDAWCAGPCRRFVADGIDGEPLATLVGQSIALGVKARGDLRAIGEHAGHLELRYAIEAELMLDAAIALALVKELEQAVNVAVREADRDRAAGLTRLMNETRRLAVSVRRVLADVEHDRVDRLAGSLTDRPLADAVVAPRSRGPATIGAPRRDRRREQWRRVLVLGRARRRADDPWMPSRRGLVLTILLACVACWTAVTVLPRLGTTSAVTISEADLVHAHRFAAVDVRAGSVFVTVDTKTWETWETDERTAALAAIGSVLRERGYRGLFVRDTDGRAVARWLAERDVELLGPPTSDPVADDGRVRTLGFVF